MAIELDDLNRMIDLAHLRVEDSHRPQLLTQLQNVFFHMKALDQLDLDSVMPVSEAFQTLDSLREDSPTVFESSRIKSNAPSWEGDCFRVPKILEDPA